jgi:hypothetical protein
VQKLQIILQALDVSDVEQFFKRDCAEFQKMFTSNVKIYAQTTPLFLATRAFLSTFPIESGQTSRDPSQTSSPFPWQTLDSG